MRAFAVGCFLLSLVFAASAQPILAPSEQPIEAPKVEPEHRPENGVQPQEQTAPQPERAADTPPVIPGVHAPGTHGEGQRKAQEGGEEGTEFWPPFLGYRLKVTDTLIVAFTALLFIATIALWWATKRLVKGAEQTAERQLRAYVHVRKAEIRAANEEYPPNFMVQFENFGATPAYKAVSIIALNDKRAGDDNFDISKGEKSGRQDIAPRQFVTMTTIPDYEGWLLGKKRLISRKNILYLFGKLHYVDAFGEDRVTHFRFKLPIDDDGITDGPLDLCKEGNEST